MNCLIVIPARWASTRLPGKPLIPIAGVALLQRTIDLARRATRGLNDIAVVVATDDRRISDFANLCDCPSIMTDTAITSGSGRVLAAAVTVSPSPTAVVNLQGDAPLLPASSVRAIIAALADGASVVTPVVQLDWRELDDMRRHKKQAPFSGTTCVIDREGRALWFSKQILPALRDEPGLRVEGPRSPVFRHLGLYGYSLDTLKRFEAAAPSPYEELEGLEQLRFLEMGITVHTVRVNDPHLMSGIDTLHDVKLAEDIIAIHGDPYGT